MSNNTPRKLYLFTGKGGVGKTSLSLAFAESLKKQSVDVHYVTFSSSSMNKQKRQQFQELKSYLKEISLPLVTLELEETIQNYIGMKFNSKTIAQFIVRAPFFRSLINIIPGFNYVIFMGQLMKYIKDNPKSVYIIDGPASGHGLTLLSAIYKFREIFGSGLLFQDCVELIEFLEKTENFKINLATLPQGLVANETLETYQEIQKIYEFPTKILINQSISHIQDLHNSKFLAQYREREVASLEMLQGHEPAQVPLLPGQSFFETVHKISESSLENLL